MRSSVSSRARSSARSLLFSSALLGPDGRSHSEGWSVSERGSSNLSLGEPSQEDYVHTHRFGRKLKLPSTISIKHQIRKLMIEDLSTELEALQRAETLSGPAAIMPLLASK